jgi:hypothetical protein
VAKGDPPERAFALILAALVRQDATGDVELAWRVAEMVASLARPDSRLEE